MKKLTITTLSILLGALLVIPALAQQGDLGTTVNEGLGYGTIVGWGTQDLKVTIMNVVNIIMGFLGILAILIVLTGGFKWMTAGGNDDKVAEAKKLIVAGIVGLAIVLGAYAIASFVVRSLVQATSG